NPDACYNHWEGKPSCLIGHAIAADGIDVCKVDAEFDAAGAVQSAYGQWEEDAVRLWTKAQVYQDSGVPWVKAVQFAINVVSREAFDRLVRYFAEESVTSFMTSDHWFGYPNTEEEKRAEVERASLPGGIGHTKAERILDILGLTVEEDG